MKSLDTKDKKSLGTNDKIINLQKSFITKDKPEFKIYQRKN
jgi:hypothetical protein